MQFGWNLATPRNGDSFYMSTINILHILHFSILPTKHICILVPAPLFLSLVPYMQTFSAVEYISAGNVGAI